MKRIHYSGGAEGADIAWDEIGKQHLDQESRHFYVRGYKTTYGNIGVLETPLADEADLWLLKAKAQFLPNRQFPSKNRFVNALLRRNYLQVCNTDAVFAISSFHKDGTVKGGTAWAVYMAILMDKPVFVFDQTKEKWYLYLGMGIWHQEEDIPTLTQKYTGIGTRELNEAGKKAIEDVILKSKAT